MKDKPIIQKIILAAVIQNEKRQVLILQRSSQEEVFPDMWELPSGKKEALESSDEALQREVQEETGLQIDIARPFYVFDYQVEKEKEIRDCTQINFLTKIRGESKLILSGEHQTFAWIGYDELKDYALSKETRAVIEEGFRTIT